jgi:ABC-2 type transport system permease protein
VKQSLYDVLTVAWKEWSELRDQIVRPSRGGISVLVAVAVLGIFLPLQLGEMWLSSPLMLIYWPVLASGMVSTLIADAFAGERERHTLEALLATRLPDSAILLGKVLAAVTYGVAFTAIYLVVGYLALALRHQGPGMLPIPWGHFGAIAVMVMLACAALAGAGVFVSLRAATVRQAQQTLGIAMMILFMGPFFVLQALSGEARLRLLARLTSIGAGRLALWGAAGLAMLAIVLNALALARFRRGRLSLD